MATRPVQNASNSPRKLVHLTDAPEGQEHRVYPLCGSKKQWGLILYPAPGKAVTCQRCAKIEEGLK